MAELFLKFEDRVLQELLLSGGTVTIGRQPDNLVRIDNPAVSGQHAKVYAEGDHYVIEDIESFNGTYVNGQRISKVTLKDGDNVTIGKHTIDFVMMCVRSPGPTEVSAAPLAGNSPGRHSSIPQLSWTRQKRKKCSLNTPRRLPPQARLWSGESAVFRASRGSIPRPHYVKPLAP